VNENDDSLNSRHKLRRYAENPLVQLLLDHSRIATRAYYHWKNGTTEQWWDPVVNWLQAEDEEIREIARHFVCPTFKDTRAQGLNDKAFHLQYRRIAFHVFPLGMYKTYIDVDAPNICALCGRSAPDTSFRTDAHVVPELLGNRNLLTKEECDECNSRFGRTAETELGHWLAVDRSVARVPTKNKSAAKYKRRLDLDPASSMVCDETKLNIRISPNDDTLLTTLVDQSTLNLAFRGLSFRGVSAVRSVAKSVFLCIPRELRIKFEYLRQWLMDELEAPSVEITHVFMPGTFFKTPGISVWIRDQQDELEIAEIVGMLWFGNTVLFWGSPSRSTLEPRPLLVPDLPMHAENALPKPTQLTFRNDNKIAMDGHYELKFDARWIRATGGPAPACIDFEVDGQRISIDTILNASELSEESIRYLLSDGELLCEIEIRRRPSKGYGEFLWHPLQGRDYKPPQLLKTLQLNRHVAGGGGFKVRDSTKSDDVNTSVFFEWPTGDVLCDTRELDIAIELCTHLIIINDKLGTELVYPSNLTTEDHWCAAVLAAGLTRPYVVYRPADSIVQLGFTQEELVNVREMIDSRGVLKGQLADLKFSLAGQVIEMPTKMAELKQPQFVVSEDELDAQLLNWVDGSVRYFDLKVDFLAVEFDIEAARSILDASNSPPKSA